MSNELATALWKSRKEFPAIIRDSKNPHYSSTFASLSAICSIVDPLLDANGVQYRYVLDGDCINLVFIHIESGDTETHSAPLFGDNAQQYGASSTYQRRYLLQVSLNLSTEDDDGESTMGRGSTPATQSKAPAAKVTRKTF